MTQYYIDTPGGPRGPYTREQVIAGIRGGKIPTGTMLRDAATGQSVRAVDLTVGAPAESGSYQPVAYQGGQQAPQQQNYYQQPQQNYPQQQYPQQQYDNQQAYRQPYGGQHQQPYYSNKPTSGYAIASLVLSLVTFAVCIPTWVLGIIFGVLALKETEPTGPKTGRGLAQAGIWTGVGIGVLYLLFIALIIAVEA